MTEENPRINNARNKKLSKPNYFALGRHGKTQLLDYDRKDEYHNVCIENIINRIIGTNFSNPYRKSLFGS